MKNSIIILGLVVLSFTNAKATNEFKSQDLDQEEFTTLNVENTQTVAINETDATVFNPALVIKSTYVKTVEDVVAENKLITEAQEEIAQPLSIATTIEDKIAENNQIIESTVSNELFPLDFDKINHAVKCVDVNNNAIKNADLKL